MPFRAECWNGLAERSGRMPFRAERRNGLAEWPRNTMAGRAGEPVQQETVPDSRTAEEERRSEPSAGTDVPKGWD